MYTTRRCKTIVLKCKLATQARVHWPLLFKFLDVYFSITVRIGDGDREERKWNSDERRYALFIK